MGKRILAWLFALLLLGSAALAKGDISAKAMLNEPGRRIGISQGSAADEAVASEFPEADIVYYTDNLLGYTAVAQGKLDAYVYDLVQMQLTIDNGFAGVRLLPEAMDTTVKTAVGYSDVSAIPDLEDKLNRFIAEVKADGTLDDMYRRWVTEGNGVLPEISMPENPRVHLTVGTTGTVPPYSYYEGSGLTGYDIELARRFAAWLDADLSLEIYDFGAIVPAAKSGKIDVIMSNLQYLPERFGGLPFSDILYEEKMGIMVRGDAPSAGGETAAPAYAAYNGKRLGVLTGPLMEDVARETFPDSEVLLFNSYPDCIAALLAGKIDACLCDELAVKSVLMERPDIDYIRERITENNYSFAFRKNDPQSAALREELNAFVAKCRADGTMDELDDIWFGTDEARKVVDRSDLTGENGAIKVVTTSTDPPFSYIKDGKNVGYDIDLVVRFCRDRGYALELGDVDFAGRIPAIESGKYDFTTDMNVTPEREEQVLFSDPVCKGGIVLAVFRASQTDYGAGASITGFSDLENGRIGATTGSVQVLQVQERFPDAELFYFTTTVDMLNALRAHKIDAFAEAEPIVKYMMIENPDLTYLDGRLGDGMRVGAIFPKTDGGQALCDEFSAFVREIRQDGVYDEIQDTWFGADEAKRVVPDLCDLPSTNGVLRMAADTTIVPFIYIKDGKPVGLDIDTVVRFCKAYGYGLEVVPMDFSGIIPSVTTGKVDFACSGIAYTPERAESVLYSEPTYESGSVIAVLKAEKNAAAATETEDDSCWAGIRSSFHKTFIREDRWKLFVQGILTTLLITALAILFGTLLGFTVFMLCRNGNPVANTVTRFCLWLVQGMPMVVLLMILYYVIFGSVAVSGIAVAVIGFTLTFGAAVFGLLKMGVGTVDRGQYEAAYALGHSNRRTFFSIILPQALPHVLPAYKGEIVGLIKATAIVGYIAVQDLTKMGDIVRSRTYEAFFPLIAVTVIYFVLEGLIGFLVSRINVSFNPKRRKPADILKGVKTDDQN